MDIFTIKPTVAASTGDTNRVIPVVDTRSLQTTTARQHEIDSYIEAGDRITIHEISGSVLDLRVEGFYQSASTEVVSGISGTYASEITTNTHWVFDKKKHRSITVTLSRQGNTITGISEEASLKITGTLVGDEIDFFTWPSDISSSEIKGKWTVKGDGETLVGKWMHPHGSGKWNLNRIGGAIAIHESRIDAIHGISIPDRVDTVIDVADIARIEIQPSDGATDDCSADAENDESLPANCRSARPNCQASDGALNAIAMAKQQKRQSDKSRALIKRAEAAAAPPECDSEKAEQLAYEARQLSYQYESSARYREEFTEDCLSDIGRGAMNDEGGVFITILSPFTTTSCVFAAITSESTKRANGSASKALQYRFVFFNRDKLARNAAMGDGEFLDAMAYLKGCSGDTFDDFSSAARQNFARIFPHSEVEPEVILVGFDLMIETDPALASGCAART